MGRTLCHPQKKGRARPAVHRAVSCAVELVLLLAVAGLVEAQPARMVKDIRPPGEQEWDSPDSEPRNLTHVGGSLYFSAYARPSPNWDESLWKSDGTEAGTVMVKEWSWSGRSNLASFVPMGDILFLAANEWGAQQYERSTLWRSDGTEPGTVALKVFHASGPTLYPLLNDLTSVNGTLFFAADDVTFGRELWKSDGTESGTVMVKDIHPTDSSWPRRLYSVNGTLYFSAFDETHGRELWKSDGTESGTVLVKDINPSGSSEPVSLTDHNGVLYFSAYDEARGRELWKSDGTASGTELVKDINPSGSSQAGLRLDGGGMHSVNGTLFFSADDGTNPIRTGLGENIELWKSDGTESGTVMVKDIHPATSSSPMHFRSVNGTLFFSADDGTSGMELWKGDGTESGTVMVKDLHPWGSSFLECLATEIGSLFFNADDGVNGR